MGAKIYLPSHVAHFNKVGSLMIIMLVGENDPSHVNMRHNTCILSLNTYAKRKALVGSASAVWAFSFACAISGPEKSTNANLNLLHSEWPNLNRVFAVLSVIGSKLKLNALVYTVSLVSLLCVS